MCDVDDLIAHIVETALKCPPDALPDIVDLVDNVLTPEVVTPISTARPFSAAEARQEIDLLSRNPAPCRSLLETTLSKSILHTACDAVLEYIGKEDFRLFSAISPACERIVLRRERQWLYRLSQMEDTSFAPTPAEQEHEHEQDTQETHQRLSINVLATHAPRLSPDVLEAHNEVYARQTQNSRRLSVPRATLGPQARRFSVDSRATDVPRVSLGPQARRFSLDSRATDVPPLNIDSRPTQIVPKLTINAMQLLPWNEDISEDASIITPPLPKKRKLRKIQRFFHNPALRAIAANVLTFLPSQQIHRLSCVCSVTNHDTAMAFIWLQRQKAAEMQRKVEEKEGDLKASRQEVQALWKNRWQRLEEVTEKNRQLRCPDLAVVPTHVCVISEEAERPKLSTMEVQDHIETLDKSSNRGITRVANKELCDFKAAYASFVTSWSKAVEIDEKLGRVDAKNLKGNVKTFASTPQLWSEKEWCREALRMAAGFKVR